MQAYTALDKRFRRLSGLGGAAAILNWDQAVMMPRGSNAVRGEQLAILAGLSHELLTDKVTGELVEQASCEELNDWQRANLVEIARHYRQAVAVPPDLVEAQTLASNACEMAWRDAREQSDFKSLLPFMDEVIKLTREAAKLKGAALELDPYNAMLDQFQPGLDAEQIEMLFGELASALPGMIDDALSRQTKAIAPKGPFPAAKQKALGRALMSQIGFDFERGRLDESTHPFCGGCPGDVRLTTRYSEDEVVSALMGVLHETGHALYESNLPADYRHVPVGEARGMAVHESQSLIMEMQACRSPAFIGYLAGQMTDTFGQDPAFERANLLTLYTQVERGLIRVDADELTYPLHIALRFELERALIDGQLATADLPGAWADGMRQHLGIEVPDDRRGVLQDIHWPVGAIGYFPSYTLGALLAAQLFKAAQAAVPGLLDAIGQGDFAPLLSWLREHIHAQGSRYGMPELVMRATGKPLGTADFLAHAQIRYGV